MDALTDNQRSVVERGYEGCFHIFIRYANWDNRPEVLLSGFEEALKISVYPTLHNVIKYDALIGIDPLERVIKIMWDEYSQKIRVYYMTRQTR